LYERSRRYENHDTGTAGIYGWKERDENLILAGIFTGYPLLLIRTHGTAKTCLATMFV